MALTKSFFLETYQGKLSKLGAGHCVTLNT
jgi:hypothetical protein